MAAFAFLARGAFFCGTALGCAFLFYVVVLQLLQTQYCALNVCVPVQRLLPQAGAHLDMYLTMATRALGDAPRWRRGAPRWRSGAGGLAMAAGRAARHWHRGAPRWRRGARGLATATTIRRSPRFGPSNWPWQLPPLQCPKARLAPALWRPLAAVRPVDQPSFPDDATTANIRPGASTSSLSTARGAVLCPGLALSPLQRLQGEWTWIGDTIPGEQSV